MSGRFTIIPTTALSAGWGGDDVWRAASYQSWMRVIDDHPLGFHPARSEGAFPRNFNPQPRRVARIIWVVYRPVDARTNLESRTIPPVEGTRVTWKRAGDTTTPALSTWRLRATRAQYRLLADVEKGMIIWISSSQWASREPPPVGHLTTCSLPTISDYLECAIVDTRADLHI